MKKLNHKVLHSDLPPEEELPSTPPQEPSQKQQRKQKKEQQKKEKRTHIPLELTPDEKNQHLKGREPVMQKQSHPIPKN